MPRSLKAYPKHQLVKALCLQWAREFPAPDEDQWTTWYFFIRVIKLKDGSDLLEGVFPLLNCLKYTALIQRVGGRIKKATVGPGLIASWLDCAMQEFSLRYIPSQALVFSTQLQQQTSWSANKVVSSGTCTAAHRVHRRLLSMQRSSSSIFQSDYTAPCSSSLKPSWQFTNIFITFFFLLQSKRTDKLSGTSDFLVNVWPAASTPSLYKRSRPHYIKQTGFPRLHRTLRILLCVQVNSMFPSLQMSTIVSNRIQEV